MIMYAVSLVACLIKLVGSMRPLIELNSRAGGGWGGSEVGGGVVGVWGWARDGKVGDWVRVSE